MLGKKTFIKLLLLLIVSGHGNLLDKSYDLFISFTLIWSRLTAPLTPAARSLSPFRDYSQKPSASLRYTILTRLSPLKCTEFCQRKISFRQFRRTQVPKNKLHSNTYTVFFFFILLFFIKFFFLITLVNIFPYFLSNQELYNCILFLFKVQLSK